jgi:predicted metalloprotease with PDZ domain
VNERSRLSGCQVAGIVLAILLVATVCMATGLVVGGGIGLLTGGTAGYAFGRARSTHVEPRIEIPMPQPREEEQERLPEEVPEVEIRPYLGVRYETIAEGARIVEVTPESPAGQSGLREGDVILAVDRALVGEGDPDLTARILQHEPGDTVELRVQRSDEELELEITLGMQAVFEGHPLFPPGEFTMPPWWQNPPEEWPRERPYLGVHVRQLEKGAEVIAVVPESPADGAGLREGDLILAVSDEAVSRETPLVGLIAAHWPGDVVVLTVEQDGREREIEVELSEWPAPEEPGAMGDG